MIHTSAVFGSFISNFQFSAYERPRTISIENSSSGDLSLRRDRHTAVRDHDQHVDGEIDTAAINKRFAHHDMIGVDVLLLISIRVAVL